MAIRSIHEKDYKQEITADQEKKSLYGEIFTPFSLIKDMFDLLPKGAFKDPNARWLDPGAGTGFFSIFLFWRLDEGLESEIPDKTERQTHIIENMIYMVEIQSDNVQHLRHLFGPRGNIIEGDFTALKSELRFDYVIGNPPYNANGSKKVPTNDVKDKKNDGKTIWIAFLKRAISLTKPKGKVLFIVPSIWMKPDRARTYHYLMDYKIAKLRCLTNTETNRIFSMEAQTPTCFFLLVNEKNDYAVDLYDKDRKGYCRYALDPGKPIPVFGATIIGKLRPFVEAFGHLRVKKTNLPLRGSRFSNTLEEGYSYANVRTAILEGLNPRLVINYSNSPQAHYGERKLILPHKMYGFPYIDMDGEYGISNRDNYVILNRSKDDLEILRQFFSTKTALYLFEATRYRMKYLEKYAFELMPDIPRLPGLPNPITDDSIAQYFGFDAIDKRNIRALHRKAYTFNYDPTL